jgi:diguanylate cyclase (GGDEF)-like protein
MDDSELLIGALLALSLIIIFLLIIVINAKARIRGKTLIEVFLISDFIYTLGYTCELAGDVMSQKLFFNHFQYIGLVLIAPVWYLISIQYRNRESKWKNFKYLVFIIPAIALIGNFTYDINGYYYKSYFYSLDNIGCTVIVFEKGFLYYINNIFSAVLEILAAVNYYNVFRKTAGTVKKQSVFLISLSVIGFFISFNCITSRYTSNIDVGAIFIGLSGVILLITLFKYELLDLLPLAYFKVFESSDSPIIVLSDAQRIVKCNASAMTVFGDNIKKYSKLQDIFGDEPEFLNSLVENKNYITKRTVNGKQMFFGSKLIKLDVQNNEKVDEYGYLLMFTDETEHINEMQTLETAASVDTLTGVFNRRYFYMNAEKIIEKAKSEGNPFSMIMLDIDKFKSINDNYGHLAGDYVLKTLCDIIRKILNPNDLIARYGGEEFILLLPGSDYMSAIDIAEKICMDIRNNPFEYGEENIKVTVSEGVYSPELPVPDDMDLEDFIDSADNALYNAKKKGRNSVCGKTDSNRGGYCGC